MSLEELRERNKKLVTEKALECFIESGIDKTKISDIARRAGLTERSVYRYFATKTDLLIAASFLYWDKAEKYTREALDKASRPSMSRLGYGKEEIIALIRSDTGEAMANANI